jgi:hypothetical protein
MSNTRNGRRHRHTEHTFNGQGHQRPPSKTIAKPETSKQRERRLDDRENEPDQPLQHHEDHAAPQPERLPRWNFHFAPPQSYSVRPAGINCLGMVMGNHTKENGRTFRTNGYARSRFPRRVRCRYHSRGGRNSGTTRVHTRLTAQRLLIESGGRAVGLTIIRELLNLRSGSISGYAVIRPVSRSYNREISLRGL